MLLETDEQCRHYHAKFFFRLLEIFLIAILFFSSCFFPFQLENFNFKLTEDVWSARDYVFLTGSCSTKSNQIVNSHTQSRA